MQQGNDNWTAWRKKGLGSSDAPTIMGVSPWKTRFQLWEEKVGIGKPFMGNFATQRGTEMEPRARAAFELESGYDFSPIVAEHANYPFIRASLDGFNKEINSILEIKCPGKEDHETAKSGKVPEKYWPQLQHQLLVTGAAQCFYYSYDGETGATVVVKPDVEYIKSLLEAETAFWDLVMNKVPPEMTDKDAEIVEEDKYVYLADQYAEVDAKIKSLEAELKKLKEIIVEKCTHARTKIGKLTITRSVRAGSVDYTKIPELKNIEVDQYRKEPTAVVTIKVGK
jgi:putative phage-type endonuclease